MSVSQKSIAEELKVTQATVSKALRGHPDISDDMKALVEATAKRLGYQPNPYVQALMTGRRSPRGMPEEGVILPYFTSYPVDYIGVIADTFERASEQANTLGFSLKAFPMPLDASKARALHRQFQKSHIYALVFGPTKERTIIKEFPWDHYALVAISEFFDEPTIDRVNADHHDNIQKALLHLLETGSQRIGMVIPKENNMNVNRSWSSPFLDFQHRKMTSQTKVSLLELEEINEQFIQQWYQKFQPDTIIYFPDSLRPIMDNLTDEPLRLVLIQWHEEFGKGIEGIDIKPGLIGAAAVDFVVSKAKRSQFGLSETPLNILIRGQWQPLEGP